MFQRGEFSVVQYFIDDSYERVREFVSAEEAMKAFQHYITCVGARIGTTKRVMITDGGDCTNALWEFGKGLVYPTKEDCEAFQKKEKEDGK